MKSHYTELKDGSILIEWAGVDVRFCINIELDPSASGWCYVTKDGKENDSGVLPPEFVRLLRTAEVDQRMWSKRCPNCGEVYDSEELFDNHACAERPHR